WFKGMNDEETSFLTMAMAESGDMLDLSEIKKSTGGQPIIDKHSTGGVGDKTTLIIGPILAALGVHVAKMSGRGLGHTGGTIDKLESIPGFSSELTEEEFLEQVKSVGFADMCQTRNLAPADKKIYALRDVTGTVDNYSLIASSIMSKKLASGADGIVLDVKCGSGAFMKDIDHARALANEMVKIGKGAGKNMRALITDMDEPLGFAVGNILEVKEAIDTLKGKGPEDFTDLCLLLGSRMVLLSGLASDEKEAEDMLKASIADGRALDQLARFVKAQGGDDSYVYDPSKFENAAFTKVLTADKDGFVESIICDEAGLSSMMLGGGREKKDDIIDLSVGIVFEKKKGDAVKKGDSIAVLHYNDETKIDAAFERLSNAVTIGEKDPGRKKILLDEI
ncbi:MAG: thymidine phosphorylase, partial [Lachnospiraceae bacterium]|nr:thymidine phosphorylase [Lachnospiraceae bacterium]